MHDLVTPFDGGEHVVPLPFDVRSVGVQGRFQTRSRKDRLAGRDVRGQRDARPDGNKAEIDDHIHGLFGNEDGVAAQQVRTQRGLRGQCSLDSLGIHGVPLVMDEGLPDRGYGQVQLADLPHLALLEGLGGSER